MGTGTVRAAPLAKEPGGGGMGLGRLHDYICVYIYIYMLQPFGFPPLGAVPPTPCGGWMGRGWLGSRVIWELCEVREVLGTIHRYIYI